MARALAAVATPPQAWPRGVRRPKVQTILRGTPGQIIAPLVSSIVAMVAADAFNFRALVAVDDDLRLHILAADCAAANWLFERFPHWVVGTYPAKHDAERLEADLCERWEELV